MCLGVEGELPEVDMADQCDATDSSGWALAEHPPCVAISLVQYILASHIIFESTVRPRPAQSGVLALPHPAATYITMKVYSLSLLSVSPASPAQATLLGTASDLASFSFYQRGSVSEFMAFFTKTVAERTPVNQPSSVEENSYKAHVFRVPGRGPGAMGMAGQSLV